MSMMFSDEGCAFAGHAAESFLVLKRLANDPLDVALLDPMVTGMDAVLQRAITPRVGIIEERHRTHQGRPIVPHAVKAQALG